MPHGDATATRLPILWRVVLPAILGAIGLFYSSQAPAGSGGFYAATFFIADLTPMWWTPDIQPSRAGKKGNLPPCPGTPNSSNAMP